MKDGSRPLTENTHRSAVATPVGRPHNDHRTIGERAGVGKHRVGSNRGNVQAHVSRSARAAIGAELDDDDIFPRHRRRARRQRDRAGPEPGASTTKVTVLEIVPPGFCTQTERLPADCKSAEVSDVVHCVLDAQNVVRGVPATRIIEPGPGLDVAKLFPDTSNVNPPAEPAYALEGASEEIYALPEIVTVAVAD